jgi:hypothetical protein
MPSSVGTRDSRLFLHLPDATIGQGPEEETLSMKIANRKAGIDRDLRLNNLEAFSNLGDTPEDWRRFRLKCPHFFPEDLSNWLFVYAENWAKELPEVKEVLKPPLLYYRDRLRMVWSRKDPKGVDLKLLLGFEREAREEGASQGLLMPGTLFKRKGDRKLSLGKFIPGQPIDPDQQTTFAGLPPGRPIVDGISGAITWEFGCTFQQAVYELMQQRWRAMVCAECGKYFLADKTRQTYCSSNCFGNRKRKQSLDYWNRKGRAERDKRRAKVTRKS